MSQSTSITEGGKGRPFGPVKALMVQGDDGKYFSWYPQSDKALGTLSVDKNGVYRASDSGVYGWGQVYVNVPQTDSVTGKDPDTGEEVVVRPDPETGEITETVVPVEIRVITPPTNPYGTYIDGQTITKDGMVVKAYGANGDEMQTVPIGEITINPTEAVFDPEKDRKRSGTATSDLIGGTINIYNGQGKVVPASTATLIVVIAGVHGVGASIDAAVRNNVYGTVRCIVASSERPFSYNIVYFEHHVTPEGISERYFDAPIETTDGIAYTHDDKTVYYNSFVSTDGESYTVNFNASENNSDVGALAWAMVYGDTEISPAGSPQTITVSWPRPGDGAILETTFDINVGPRGGSGED